MARKTNTPRFGKLTLPPRLLTTLVFILAIGSGSAATFTVTNTNNSGAGSLRQAVLDSNAAAGSDTIVFDPAVFSVPQTITLASVISLTPATSDTLTITGPGANLLTVSGNNAVQIFTVTSGRTVAISGMTLTQGSNNLAGAIRNPGGILTLSNMVVTANAATGNSGGAGGINSSGSLTMTNVDVTANTTAQSQGGGLGVSGTVTITNCNISNNTSAGDGGGIYSTGTLTISGTTINGNTGKAGGGIWTSTGSSSSASTITGSTISNNTGTEGAGIRNTGILTITNTLVSNNITISAGNLDGGGVYNLNTGALTVTNSVITGNSTTGNGGGIYSVPSAAALGLTLITDSSISNNISNSGSTKSSDGGGVYIGGTGPSTIMRTLITGNTARRTVGNTLSGRGGGIRTSGSLNLINSTVSGNTAENEYGGIYDATGGGSVAITDCTIVSNTATNGNIGGYGLIAGSGGTGSIRNTIVANNNSTGGGTRDLGGPINSLGYNLFKNITGATFTGDTSTNIVGVDPNLKPLGNYGGPTQTHALNIDSPAIDKGDSSGATTDQRGLVRPSDAAGISNASDGADIGAVEAQPPTAVDDTSNVNEDNAVVISVLANDADVDGDTFSVSQVTQGTNGTVTTNGTTVTYTPNANFFGSDSFTYRISDGIFTSNSATVNVTVNPINDAPSFTKGPDQTVNEDAGAQTVNGWATNISQGPNESGQTLTFNVSVTSITGGLTFSSGPAINASTGTLTYAPAADSNGTATVSVTLSDNGSNTPPNVNTSAAQTFTITVNAVNDPPTLNPIGNPASIPEDSPQQTINLSGITVGPANEAGQTLSVSASSSNTTLIPTPSVTYTSPSSTGSLNYTPGPDQFGSAVITVTVQDSGGSANSITRTFTVNVTPVNDAPIITGQMPVSTEYNTARTIMFSDLQVTDVDNPYPTGFTLTVMDGVNYTRSGNTITPALNFYGTLTVPVKVNDGALDSNTYQLQLVVNPDPAAVKSMARIEKEPGGGYRITFIGNPGQQYTVQFATTLTPTTNWQFLALKVASAQGTYFVIDNPPAGNTTRFYRAILP